MDERQKANQKFQTKQYPIGYCAICKAYGPLTEDHIFLKALESGRRRSVRSLIPKKDGTHNSRLVQSGVKFKTICEECNSIRLGGNYDPAFLNLCKQVTQQLEIANKTGLIIPDNTKVKYCPQRVARAVIGHSLATQIIEDVNVSPKPGLFQEAMRNYFLNDRVPLPPEIEIYYWFYPSKKQVALNYWCILKIGWQGSVLGNFLKSYPFGFWITFDKPKEVQIKLPKLIPRGRMDLNDEVDEVIRFRCPFSIDWPEIPGDDDMLLGPDRAALISEELKTKTIR